ncbi:uncharacterized protein LOC106705774 [Latimeria chalumnae]|uniref:uncharacterized protein LOC106705774 n=1 Tax=Latimeria chalumnae TaxID=7897 RepID=UPI0006D90843|nr:PREDICTED: uncharacterized protein LOC106705774 [Latimeria chalumnae]|eukprot:XP_014351234.1 PREDICTED: uncharacterized protein LOC106705774 [Latimeria chalumnae]
MALFGKLLEPVGYMQSLRSLSLGIVTYLQDNAKPEELEFVKKNLEIIDRELSAGKGLINDCDVKYCEDNIVVVYYQLGLSIRADKQYTKKETEVFLKYFEDYKIERQLNALYNRLVGASVLTNQKTLLDFVIRDHKPKRWEMKEFCEKINFVMGTGLLCLFCQASLSGRDLPMMAKQWLDKMAALYKKMKSMGDECVHYFREQAEADIGRLMQAKPKQKHEEMATVILKELEKNYDWMRWSVMVSKSQENTEEEKEVLVKGNFISVKQESGLQAVACYSESPSSLDKGRIHQLIVDLEWKLPNPPPEVYANIEANPNYAKTYLAQRMLQKLEEGLGEGVTIHVVPGKLEIKCNFPQVSYVHYEYRHRLATGTVCLFG